METTLQQILKVQLAILAELRQLRQALAPQATAAAPQKAAPTPEAAPAPRPAPVAPGPDAAAEIHEPTAVAAPQAPSVPEPLPPLAPPAATSATMLTPDELADLGGQFFDPGQKPRTRTKPVVASDLSESILSDIKAKNKAKRSAFSEFEKFGRDR